MATEQERHVFCAWCWRAVPAHGNTYVPRPHPDTLGKPCRGEAMCGATTYSVGTPPCERDKGRAFAYAVPSARDIEAVLAERSTEAEALRGEVARLRKELDAEREACAAIADEAARATLMRDGARPIVDPYGAMATQAQGIADAIRARGKAAL